jgi:hypothetical protein
MKNEYITYLHNHTNSIIIEQRRADILWQFVK